MKIIKLVDVVQTNLEITVPTVVIEKTLKFCGSNADASIMILKFLWDKSSTMKRYIPLIPVNIPMYSNINDAIIKIDPIDFFEERDYEKINLYCLDRSGIILYKSININNDLTKGMFEPLSYHLLSNYTWIDMMKFSNGFVLKSNDPKIYFLYNKNNKMSGIILLSNI